MKGHLILGAHMSISEGYAGAIRAAESIGSTTMQIFTANQRQWHQKSIGEEEVLAYRKAIEVSSIQEVMSHDSYLINLGSPKEEVRTKSIKAFQHEIERCQALGIHRLNFHPGAALDGTREECLDKIVEALLSVEPLITRGRHAPTLIMECTAGQGSQVGNSFQELHYILEKTKNLPMGICIDTCHAFAAGYDLRTEDALENTLRDFDSIIGLKYLKALHLNDSEKGIGSHVDRHAPLGEGKLGLECFKAIVQHPILSFVPMYLETPGGGMLWKKEIALLRSFATL